MAKRRTHSNRRDLAIWLMMLLPGFMFVGFFAPAAVKVKPKPREEVGPISFRNFAPRRPIQFALPTGHRVLSAASGLESTFVGARYVVDEPRRDTIDVAAANDGGNEIVLNEDNVETYVAETIFETPIDDPQPQLVVDLTPLWDPALFDVIPYMIDRSASTQWDDFHGTSGHISAAPATSPVIPEPATGALLALGLAALGMRRRR